MTTIEIGVPPSLRRLLRGRSLEDLAAEGLLREALLRQIAEAEHVTSQPGTDEEALPAALRIDRQIKHALARHYRIPATRT